MLKKKNILLSALMVFALIMAGCANTQDKGSTQSSSSASNQENEKYQKYLDARVKYLGDNSKVSNLLDVLGAGALGEYTIALKTDKEPYGLTINYSNLKNEAGKDLAYYALALIENLSVVEVNYGDHSYRLTKDEADDAVKGDIKDYGRTVEKLKELSQILSSSD